MHGWRASMFRSLTAILTSNVRCDHSIPIITVLLPPGIAVNNHRHCKGWYGNKRLKLWHDPFSKFGRFYTRSFDKITHKSNNRIMRQRPGGENIPLRCWSRFQMICLDVFVLMSELSELGTEKSAIMQLTIMPTAELYKERSTFLCNCTLDMAVFGCT